VQPGILWREIIKTELTDTDMGIFFLTRESIWSPWVLFEGGAIGKLPGSRVFIVLVDVENNNLPSPFKQFQATPLKQDKMWELVKAINDELPKKIRRKHSIQILNNKFLEWWHGYKSKIDKAVKSTFSGSGDWTNVNEALISGRIANSPFQARDLFRIAKYRIDFIAQNHYYITVDEKKEHTILLKRFLKRNNRTVNILAMKPKNDKGDDTDAVKAWTELMSPNFPGDLKNALETLLYWKRLATEENWHGKLNIRLTGLIPTSQNFFDANHPRGGLIITPMINKSSNYDRPVVFITKKENRVAFESYWIAYIERFRRAEKLR